MNTRWLIKNWFNIGSKISWKLSFETLIGLLYFIPFFKCDFLYGFIERKHRYILDYLNKNYHYLIKQYQTWQTSIIEDENCNSRIIWVMWWQGEDVAPEIVKMCISSMRRNSNGAQVIVITKDNYSDYIDLPEYILEKQAKGMISFAHLADIIRVFLLAQYGGLWLDSTIYVSQPIPVEIFSKKFYSLHSNHHKTPFVADDRFYTFVMGARQASALFCFEKDFFLGYCKSNEVMIDYYLLDYSIMFQYFNIPEIKETIDGLEVTSETLYSLVSILNKPFDEAKLKVALDQNLFSKLKWNGSHKLKTHNIETNYAVLLRMNNLL